MKGKKQESSKLEVASGKLEVESGKSKNGSNHNTHLPVTTTHLPLKTTYRISTTISTLKRVWNILRDMNLDGLLTGNPTEFNLKNLLDALLWDSRITDLLEAIAGKDTVYDELELSEVTSILAAFFAAIKEAFPDVAGLVGKVVS